MEPLDHFGKALARACRAAMAARHFCVDDILDVIRDVVGISKGMYGVVCQFVDTSLVAGMYLRTRKHAALNMLLPRAFAPDAPLCGTDAVEGSKAAMALMADMPIVCKMLERRVDSAAAEAAAANANPAYLLDIGQDREDKRETLVSYLTTIVCLCQSMCPFVLPCLDFSLYRVSTLHNYITTRLTYPRLQKDLMFFEPNSADEVRAILFQVLYACDALHAFCGCASHRDLHMCNMMILTHARPRQMMLAGRGGTRWFLLRTRTVVHLIDFSLFRFDSAAAAAASPDSARNAPPPPPRDLVTESSRRLYNMFRADHELGMQDYATAQDTGTHSTMTMSTVTRSDSDPATVYRLVSTEIDSHTSAMARRGTTRPSEYYDLLWILYMVRTLLGENGDTSRIAFTRASARLLAANPCERRRMRGFADSITAAAIQCRVSDLAGTPRTPAYPQRNLFGDLLASEYFADLRFAPAFVDPALLVEVWGARRLNVSAQ